MFLLDDKVLYGVSVYDELDPRGVRRYLLVVYHADAILGDVVYLCNVRCMVYVFHNAVLLVQFTAVLAALFIELYDVSSDVVWYGLGVHKFQQIKRN